MTRMRKLLLGSVTGLVALGAVGGLVAQGAPPPHDPATLPETKGVVERYSLAPRGEVDGLILKDGTQIHVPPHLAAELVDAVKPGDNVAVHGLRTLRLPLVEAASITDETDGRTVLDQGPSHWPELPSFDRRSELSAEGKVRMALYGPRGETNGALLEDGTFLRLPPHEAERLSDMLVPGRTIAARGPGVSGPNGTVIEVALMGPSLDQLGRLGPPPGKGPPPPPVPPVNSMIYNN